ncbi:hypothetical protein PR202_gb17856 [Eleusine coracana subsp. coracana]|uniref:Thiol methyltransferase 2 n=1 Tax=Eleusine coracana subsp. coracana TaxID=191504 RepID=A0AAV5F401_ELECO|nr:hypothetical protein PR202_gb17856 [Eleusine coracana subsp. coracana]
MHALSRARAPVLRCLTVTSRALLRRRAMGSSAAGGSGRDLAENPAVGKLRELFNGDAEVYHAEFPENLSRILSIVFLSDAWQKSWEAGLTPWDLGKPTPIIEHLVASGTLPKGRALVPGCGMGYDVVALASPERFVVGLDISDAAVKKAKQISDQEGPPYSNTVADYQKVLEPLGFEAVLMEDNELAIKPRKLDMLYFDVGEDATTIKQETRHGQQH